MCKKYTVIIMLAVLAAFSAYAQQQYDDEHYFQVEPLENGAARIIGYTGPGGEVHIPPRIQGMAVTEIGDEVFHRKQLTSITIGANVTMTRSAFGDRFYYSYGRYERKAGTYTYSYDQWTLR